MRITEDKKRTAISMIEAGRTGVQIVEEIGISLSSVRKIKKEYKANKSIAIEHNDTAEENPDMKANLIQRRRYQPDGEFCEEWNRAAGKVLGLADSTADFTEQWMKAVNRIRRACGLEDLNDCNES